jgi:hypothetical protein
MPLDVSSGTATDTLQLTRIYDDPTFKPSVPELVIVHMVFATIYFQYGIRNREEPEKHAQLNELSNKHYHWSLSKFFDLAISQTVTAVQALAMIVSHTRNFPKPGCSSTIANYALMKAIELNLHRAVKIPGGGTNLENEVRKRVWWAILGVMVTLNGRLGRPMPISVEEFDTEFPIAIRDELLGEDGVLDSSQIGHCNYQVGLMGFKAVPLYMEMYSKIYSVRRDPSKYTQVVRKLEAEMQNLLDNMPDELKVEKCQPGSQIFALYTQAFCLEFTLCLRHPSVCMTDDAKFCAENTRISEETARKLLKVVASLLKMKSLDTTWYQLAVYVAAIFTSLVAHWQRRFDTTAFEIATLREEMGVWLSIIGEIGRLLGKRWLRIAHAALTDESVGTGNRLAAEISAIIERTISWIEQDMGRKPGSQPGHTPDDKRPSPAYQQPSVKPEPQSSNTLVSSSGLGSAAGEQRNTGTANGNSFYESGGAASSTPYPAMGYSDQATGRVSTHGHQNGNGMSASNACDSSDDSQYLYAAASAVTAATAPNVTTAGEQAASAQNPLVAFASQATQHVTGQGQDNWPSQPHLMGHNPGSANPWHDWTAAIADSQDRYSANALLTLGSGRPGDVGAGGVVDHIGQGESMGVGNVGNSHSGQWPLLLFDGSGAVSGA